MFGIVLSNVLQCIKNRLQSILCSQNICWGKYHRRHNNWPYFNALIKPGLWGIVSTITVIIHVICTMLEGRFKERKVQVLCYRSMPYIPGDWVEHQLWWWQLAISQHTHNWDLVEFIIRICACVYIYIFTHIQNCNGSSAVKILNAVRSHHWKSAFHYAASGSSTAPNATRRTSCKDGTTGNT